MPNLTLSLDEATYRAARIAAAEQGTSVSALVRDHLRQLAGHHDEAVRLRALFDALDQAQPGANAADRLSRDQAHARRS